MKKTISILLALVLLVSMLLIFVFPVPASACTPPLRVPDMPEIPDISDNVQVDTKPAVDAWFEAHPIRFDWSMIKIDWSKYLK